MNDFIKYFSKFKWNFEFILNNKNELNKVLFYFENNNSKLIFDYINNNSKLIFDYINNNIELNNKIKQIFNLYWKYINHIWYDKKNNRYKFYIWLYDKNLKDSLRIISNCKNVLWINKKYFLEKDFYKFDSIWFDISNNWIDMKIYELVKKENNYAGLPNFIDINKMNIFTGNLLRKFPAKIKKQILNLFF